SDFIIANDSSILNNANQISIARVSVPGGTALSEVAEAIGLSTKKMKEYNSHLRYGFTPPNLKEYYLYIPLNKKDIFATNFKPMDSKSFKIYDVKKGDTIAKIATKWKVSPIEIQKYNDITKVKPNDKIIILTSKNSQALANYIVKKGDTLLGISKKFDVQVKDIVELNNLKSSSLGIGDSIVIPK
ncbi:MAG: LysM peptidoglycan-binding domain-containing protein, partial [Campylobacter hyointestinalis]